MNLNPESPTLKDKLAAVNGRAKAHTFSDTELRGRIKRRIEWLRKLVPAHELHHYTMVLFSGAHVSRNYSQPRVLNRVAVNFTKAGEPRITGIDATLISGNPSDRMLDIADPQYRAAMIQRLYYSFLQFQPKN